MAKYEKCSSCGEHGWLYEPGENNILAHRCKPAWQWWTEEYGLGADGQPDWQDIRAVDEEDAAQKAGELYDEEDHPLLQGGEVVIHVRSPNGDLTKWNVTGESVPEYSAHRIKDAEA